MERRRDSTASILLAYPPCTWRKSQTGKQRANTTTGDSRDDDAALFIYLFRRRRADVAWLALKLRALPPGLDNLHQPPLSLSSQFLETKQKEAAIKVRGESGRVRNFGEEGLHTALLLPYPNPNPRHLSLFLGSIHKTPL